MGRFLERQGPLPKRKWDTGHSRRRSRWPCHRPLCLLEGRPARSRERSGQPPPPPHVGPKASEAPGGSAEGGVKVSSAPRAQSTVPGYQALGAPKDGLQMSKVGLHMSPPPWAIPVTGLILEIRSLHFSTPAPPPRLALPLDFCPSQAWVRTGWPPGASQGTGTQEGAVCAMKG